MLEFPGAEVYISKIKTHKCFKCTKNISRAEETNFLKDSRYFKNLITKHTTGDFKFSKDYLQWNLTKYKNTEFWKVNWLLLFEGTKLNLVSIEEKNSINKLIK